MEFSEVVRRRRMVRAYDPDRPVPAAVRDRLLATALRAPSAGFSQGWGFLVLEEPPDRERFWSATTVPAGAPDHPAPAGAPGRPAPAEAAGHPAPAEASRPVGDPDPWLASMRRAPLLVVCFSHKDAYLDRYAEPDKGWSDRDERRWPVPYWDIDTGFAALLMLLDAVDQNLGACFFGVPPEQVDALRRAFGVPRAFNPVGVVSIGYPAPDRRSPSLRRGHRPVDQVVHHGRWSGVS